MKRLVIIAELLLVVLLLAMAMQWFAFSSHPQSSHDKVEAGKSLPAQKNLFPSILLVDQSGTAFN
ncbi:MAG: hypothetical protein ACJ75B_21985 [Flavisolibacter sp.]